MSKKILIIEDDKDIVDLLKHYLTKDNNNLHFLLNDFCLSLNNYCCDLKVVGQDFVPLSMR